MKTLSALAFAACLLVGYGVLAFFSRSMRAPRLFKKEDLTVDRHGDTWDMHGRLVLSLREVAAIGAGAIIIIAALAAFVTKISGGW